MTAPLHPRIQSVRDLLENRWGVPLTPRTNNPQVLTSVTVLLKQDAARVGFLIVNTGASDFMLAPNQPPGVGSLTGVRLVANGGAVSVNWEEDGETVAYEWITQSLGAATNAYVMEILLYQGREVRPK